MGGFEESIKKSLNLSEEERAIIVASFNKPILKDGKELTRVEGLISLDHEGFMLDLGNLLHELQFCRTKKEFKKLVNKEPKNGLTDNSLHYAFVAGVIEFFAARHTWIAPSWVLSAKYISKEPWYAISWEPDRQRIKSLTPYCLTRRNIFTTEKGLISM